jgi:hypothetical protein
MTELSSEAAVPKLCQNRSKTLRHRRENWELDEEGAMLRHVILGRCDSNLNFNFSPPHLVPFLFLLDFTWSFLRQ